MGLLNFAIKHVSSFFKPCMKSSVKQCTTKISNIYGPISNPNGVKDFLKAVKQRGNLLVETKSENIFKRTAFGVGYTVPGQRTSFYRLTKNGDKVWLKDRIIYDRTNSSKIVREDRLKDHNTMVTRTRQYDKEHNLTSLYREKMTQIYPGDFQRHKQYTLYDFKNKKYDDLYMGYFRNGQQEYLKESGELIAVDSKAAKSANNVICGHKVEITHNEKRGI